MSAVLPTPGSPMKRGLFLSFRHNMRTHLDNSFSLPMSGFLFLYVLLRHTTRSSHGSWLCLSSLSASIEFMVSISLFVSSIILLKNSCLLKSPMSSLSSKPHPFPISSNERYSLLSLQYVLLRLSSHPECLSPRYFKRRNLAMLLSSNS